MANENPGKPGLSISDIRNRSGMMDGTQEDVSTVLPPEELPAPVVAKVELEKKDEHPAEKPAPKSEVKSEEDDTDEDDTDDDTDEINDGAEDKSKSDASAKPSRPLRTAFQQIREIRREMNSSNTEMAKALQGIAELVAASKTGTVAEKAEAKVDVDTFLAKAKDAGVDEEWLKGYTETLLASSKAEIESLIKPLREELDATKKTASDLQAERAAQKLQRTETGIFVQEWGEQLSSLQKEFPNATPELLREAQTLMRTLSTSKEYGGTEYDPSTGKMIGPEKAPMPLDYILFREKAKFATILNVKKGSSGERPTTDPAEREDTGKSEDIDLNPENMTPTKWKEHEKRKQAEAGQGEKAEIINFQ
jgi:DNA-binding transcriptional regulator YiaG